MVLWVTDQKLLRTFEVLATLGGSSGITGTREALYLRSAGLCWGAWKLGISLLSFSIEPRSSTVKILLYSRWFLQKWKLKVTH